MMKNKLISLLFVLFLSACGTGSGPNIKPGNDKAKNNGLMLYQQNDYFLAIDYLLQAWENSPEDEEVYIALLDSWSQLGEFPRVWQMLSDANIRPPEIDVIEAEILAQQQQCRGSIVTEDYFNTQSLNNDWLKRFWQVKATCHMKLNENLAAALAFIQLNQLLSDAVLKQSNNDLIVKNLIAVDETQLIMAIGSAVDELTQGWIEAAYINFGADGVSGNGWLQEWTKHPASFYFLDMNQINKQQHVAVLLPFSGRFATVANAVQKGMLTAAMADQVVGNKLTFYDTGSAGEGLSNAWYSAQENHADLIIGPLDKDSIEALKLVPEPTVPVVLLNQSDSPYLQFSLSPEGEAEAAASKMMSDGMTRVLIMAPNDSWGERMTKAFAQKFVDLGGLVQNNTYLQPEQNDYSAQLRQNLGLIESQLRAKNLQQFLNLKINAEEVVRTDIDAIFLAAKPAFARLLIPQLKFHHAAGIPVYSTSHVFDGMNNEQHNKDLEGVRFAISPIELQAEYLFETLPFDIRKIKHDKQLFAFGYDAYQLIARLNWMSRVSTGVVDGLTGKISLDRDNHFNRELLWANFRNGFIVPLTP